MPTHSAIAWHAAVAAQPFDAAAWLATLTLTRAQRRFAAELASHADPCGELDASAHLLRRVIGRKARLSVKGADRAVQALREVGALILVRRGNRSLAVPARYLLTVPHGVVSTRTVAA